MSEFQVIWIVVASAVGWVVGVACGYVIASKVQIAAVAQLLEHERLRVVKDAMIAHYDKEKDDGV